MKLFTLTFTIDETIYPPGAWENPYQLSVALKLYLQHRYGFEQIMDVQPAEKPKPVRAFCVVQK